MSLKTTPLTGLGKISDCVRVVEVRHLSDGYKTIVVLACNTLIELTMNEQDAQTHYAHTVYSEAVRKACRGKND